MDASKSSLNQKAILAVLILGLVAFIVYFFLFINPAQVADILSRINIKYYTAAFVAYCLYAFFSALVWRHLLNSLQVELSTRKALLFTWVGLFFEATVPQLGWSGEVSKTYMLTKDSRNDAGKIGASVVGQKIINMTITVVAMALGLSFVLISYPLPTIVTLLVSIVLALSIFTLLLVYYISIKPFATNKLLNWAIRIILFFRRNWNSLNFRVTAQEFLERFHDGIQQLSAKPKELVKPAIYAIISFTFEVSVTFLTFVALGYSVPVDKVLIVFTLTGTLQTVGITFFGFPELIMSVSFTAMGIPAALSVSVTLLTRVVSLWFRLVVSYVALQWAGIKLIRKK